MTQGETQMQTQEADGRSLTMFINPKGSAREEWQNGQAGKYKVQKQVRVKTGGLEKGECKKHENGKNAG